MHTEIKLGIWMDYQSAKVISYNTNNLETENVQSASTQKMNHEGLSSSEHVMNNKEQNMQNNYFKDLKDIIKQYSDVLLFGPTNSKIELFNLLKLDSHFAGINIHVESSDKLTEPQQHAFVKNFFTTSE
jgi:Lhr-like helicase